VQAQPDSVQQYTRVFPATALMKTRKLCRGVAQTFTRFLGRVLHTGVGTCIYLIRRWSTRGSSARTDSQSLLHDGIRSLGSAACLPTLVCFFFES